MLARYWLYYIGFIKNMASLDTDIDMLLFKRKPFHGMLKFKKTPQNACLPKSKSKYHGLYLIIH